MIFNSIDFLFFFPAVVILYFAIPFGYRWLLLLIASYFFYMYWKVEYALLIVASTLIDYYAGYKMSSIKSKKARRPFLIISIFSNLGMLFVFKYFNFFADSVNAILVAANMHYSIPAVNFLLPIGISFYTFQTMSYTIDVYKGKVNAERHLGIFAVYVSYFPQLVAGPIERSQNLIHQLREKFGFDYGRVSDGLKLMGWGLFKKVVVADQIALMVDYYYRQPSEFGGFTTIFVSILFAYQVYCDFSGYSDIAIGAASVMGIHLMENFRRPFYAQSLAELWSRWHISLTTWFRDYLFFPLVRNKKLLWPWYYNVAVIYVLSGLWHGANWTFFLWGFFTSLIIILSRMTPVIRNKIHDISGLKNFPRTDRIVHALITLLIFGLLGIYFRSASVNTAHLVFSNLFSSWFADIRDIVLNLGKGRVHHLYLGYNIFQFTITLFSVFILELIQFLQETRGSVRKMVARQPVAIRWFLYLSLAITIILFSFDKQIPFIYFQF